MPIRPMTARDFPEAYALWKHTLTETKSFAEERREVMMMLKRNPMSCLVDVEDGHVVGTVLGVFNGKRAWIYHLAIDPAYQKAGLGSRLLAAAEDKLKKEGASAVFLWVMYANFQAIPFYLKRDYAAFSNAVAMRKEL